MKHLFYIIILCLAKVGCSCPFNPSTYGLRELVEQINSALNDGEKVITFTDNLGLKGERAKRYVCENRISLLYEEAKILREAEERLEGMDNELKQNGRLLEEETHERQSTTSFF